MASERLPRLAPETLREDQRALYDAITCGPRAQGPQHFALAAPDGTLNGPFNALLYSPALGTALQEVGAAVRYRTGLPDRARELAILLVAARWDSAFERDSHEAVARSLGFSEAELEAIRREDPVRSPRKRRSSPAPSSRFWTGIWMTSNGMPHDPTRA